MRKLLLITFSLINAISINLKGQCDFSDKSYTEGISHRYNIPIDKMTVSLKLVWIFKTEASFEIAKNENGYYLHLKFKYPKMKRFDLLKNNSLDFILSNGEKVQLFPIQDYLSKIYGLKVQWGFLMSAIYKIDDRQLWILGQNDLEVVSLHYTADNIIEGSRIDEEGKFSFSYDVSKYQFKGSVKYASLCILNN
jgi:hypothetical protein